MNTAPPHTWDQASGSELSIYALRNRTLPTDIHLHWLATQLPLPIPHPFFPAQIYWTLNTKDEEWSSTVSIQLPISMTLTSQKTNCHHCENLNLTTQNHLAIQSNVPMSYIHTVVILVNIIPRGPDSGY